VHILQCFVEIQTSNSENSARWMQIFQTGIKLWLLKTMQVPCKMIMNWKHAICNNFDVLCLLDIWYILWKLPSNPEYLHLPSFWVQKHEEEAIYVHSMFFFSSTMYSTLIWCFLSVYLARTTLINEDANLFYSSLYCQFSCASFHMISCYSAMLLCVRNV
jgi:hypothetical protein